MKVRSRRDAQHAAATCCRVGAILVGEAQAAEWASLAESRRQRRRGEEARHEGRAAETARGARSRAKSRVA
eukprot:6182062-Pleurochrysis_carterae.AAC.3